MALYMARWRWFPVREIASYSYSYTYKSAYVHMPRNIYINHILHLLLRLQKLIDEFVSVIEYIAEIFNPLQGGRRRVSSELLCCRASVRYRLQLNITLDNSSRGIRFCHRFNILRLNSRNFWNCVGDVHVLHRGGLVGGKVNKILPSRQSCCQNYLTGQAF